MARCKYCGNFVEDYLYEQNNGMCNLCIRTAQGEDDLIVAPKEREMELAGFTEATSDASLRKDYEKTGGFESKKYENKSLREYTFPAFLKSGVINNNGEPALLITTIKSHEIASKLTVFCDGIFFSFFALLGLLPVVLIFMAASSGEKDIWIVILFLLAFALFWNIPTYITLGRKFFRHFKKGDWILLTNDHFECCHGRQFNIKKTKPYYFDNIKISNKIEGDKYRRVYYVKISPPGLFKGAFKLEVPSGKDGHFVEAFLKWYINSKSVGGFGSGQKT